MAVVLPVAGLPELFDALHARGYTVVGPTVRDGAIVLAELESAAELPYGWGVDTEAGGYRLRRRDDTAAFGHSAGPQSWKTFLHPPRARLWSADRGATATWSVAEPAEQPPRYAFLGVRPCDLRAIGIQDRVLGRRPARRPGLRRAGDGDLDHRGQLHRAGRDLLLRLDGRRPGAPRPGFDLALTELVDGDGHRFLVRGRHATAGAGVLADAAATAGRRGRPSTPADDAVAAAADRMGRTHARGGPAANCSPAQRESPRWDDVASRCLTCGNCTMVCPTCFCTTVEDTTDLTGDHAERWRRWDSCFDLDFSYLHGGRCARRRAGRYRQWLTHKLGTWHDQFGESGCVGCGRCIAWCPVGIDITAGGTRPARRRPTRRRPS